MKLFITGISGLLGLNAAIQLRDHVEVSGCYLTHPIQVEGVRALRIDVTSHNDLRDALRVMRPDVILNTAGLTNVDSCEENPELARALNVHSTKNVARLAKSIGAKLVHVSTDHLFDGAEPFAKEETKPSPLNIYAKTKWEAEQVVQEQVPNALIIRTNFYGWGTPHKKSFSDWIIEGLSSHRQLSLFSNVFFTPIIVNDLVDVIFSLVKKGGEGIFNVPGRDRLSKLEFGFRLAEVLGYSRNGIQAVSVEQSGLQAKRPKDMSLDSRKVARFLGRPAPSVQDGLGRLKRLYQQDEWHQILKTAFCSVGRGSEFKIQTV